MNNWGKFESIYHKITFKRNQVEYNKVLSFDVLWCIYNRDIVNSFKLNQLFYCFFKSPDINPIKKSIYSNKLLVTNKTKRADYLELINNALDKIEDFNFIELSQLEYKINFSIKHFFFALYNCVFVLKEGLGLKSYLYISSKLNHYIVIAEKLNKILSSDKEKEIKLQKYLSFNSAIGFENLITQTLKREGIKTFTLSHEVLYGSYSKNIPLNNINGFNMSSDKILVWGEFSKSNLKDNFNMSEHKVVIGGNPKYKFKEIEVNKAFKRGIVILPRDIYHKSNIKLLNILKEVKSNLAIEFSLKLHPSLRFEDYEEISKKFGFEIIGKNQTLLDCLSSDNYDFSVGYNTNAYYESMYFGMCFLRFKKFENEMFLGLEDEFNDFDDFVRLIDMFKKEDSSILNSKFTDVLKKSIGLGIDQYKIHLN